MKYFKQRLTLAGIICFVLAVFQVAISCVFIIRGFLLLPELLVVVGIFHVSIPVAPRFVIFSLGSLLIGIIFIAGTIGGWRSFSYSDKSII